MSRGDCPGDPSKQRWLADIFASHHLDYQTGGGIQVHGINEIRILFEKTLFFGISIDVTMENLCDARLLTLQASTDNNQESEYPPYGDEITQALRQMLVTNRKQTDTPMIQGGS